MLFGDVPCSVTRKARSMFMKWGCPINVAFLKPYFKNALGLNDILSRGYPFSWGISKTLSAVRSSGDVRRRLENMSGRVSVEENSRPETLQCSNQVPAYEKLCCLFVSWDDSMEDKRQEVCSLSLSVLRCCSQLLSIVPFLQPTPM